MHDDDDDDDVVVVVVVAIVAELLSLLVGVRSLCWNDFIISTGGGSGRISFYDIRRNQYLDLAIESSLQPLGAPVYHHQTGKGYLVCQIFVNYYLIIRFAIQPMTPTSVVYIFLMLPILIVLTLLVCDSSLVVARSMYNLLMLFPSSSNS
jgi:hypothetical protein